MIVADMERTIAAQARVADHLRERVDDLKARLLEVSEECSKEYRRGYLAGRAASRRGDELDLDAAEARRRTRVAA